MDPDRITQDPAKPRTNRSALLWLFAVIGGICVLGAIQAPTESSTSIAPATSQAAQIKRWADSGGAAVIYAVRDASEAANHTGGNRQREAAVCTNLARAVANAQAYSPIPEQGTQALWAAALEQMSTGAAQCSRVVATGDRAVLQKMIMSVNNASTYMEIATQKVQDIQRSNS